MPSQSDSVNSNDDDDDAPHKDNHYQVGDPEGDVDTSPSHFTLPPLSPAPLPSVPQQSPPPPLRSMPPSASSPPSPPQQPLIHFSTHSKVPAAVWQSN